MNTSAPTDTAATNTTCNNHKHQVTNAVIYEVLGNLLEYQHLIKPPNVKIWELVLANDLGHWWKDTDQELPKEQTLFFIHPRAIPNERKVTYIKLVATLHPLKTKINQVRVAEGRDRLDYNGNTSYNPAILTTLKIHLNSNILTDRAIYKTLDIKKYTTERRWGNMSTHACY